MVPGARIELALCFQNRILNPARLPVPPPRQGEAEYKDVRDPSPDLIAERGCGVGIQKGEREF